MFSSISKAWNEVSDEGNSKVKFSESNHDPSKKGNGHYIHYDKSKNPLDRLKKPDTRKGSPRILKPRTENKQNSLLGSALKNLTKVFKKDDGELGEMKSYINGMIKKPEDNKSALSRSGRSKTANMADFERLGIEGRSSRRRRRTDTISSKFDNIGKSVNSDRYKKRHYDTGIDPPKYVSKYDSKRYDIDIPKYENNIHDAGPKYERKNYDVDFDIPKYESKQSYKKINDVPKYDSNNVPKYPTSLEKEGSLSNRSWRIEKHDSKTPNSGSKNIQFKKLTALDLPSSPIFYKDSPSKIETKRANETIDSQVDRSVLDSSRIEELCKKVEQLESTVDGLKDELRLANEKSIQIERSVQSNESVTKSNDQSDGLEHFKFGDDRDISRPLSPVKVDLDRFKFIR